MPKNDSADPLESKEVVTPPEPEDFLPAPRRPLTAFEKMPRQGSLLPGAVFVALMTAASLLRWWQPDKYDYFDVSRAQIFTDGQYWRLISAIFGHGDMQHLAHNVPIYLFFAWILQAYFGFLASVILPVASGIISNALTIYFYEDHVRLLGASGMIFAMVALWLVLYVRIDRGAWWVKRVMRAVGFSLLVLFPQTYEPRVSYLAHLTGFLCGAVFGVLFTKVIVKYAPVDLTRTDDIELDEKEGGHG